MKLWQAVIGMWVGAAVMVSVALAGSPTDAHERAGLLVGKAVADSHDRAGVLQAPVVVVSHDGFDWGDAFIGVLGGIGVALLLTGLLFLVMNRRGKAPMTPVTS